MDEKLKRSWGLIPLGHDCYGHVVLKSTYESLIVPWDHIWCEITDIHKMDKEQTNCPQGIRFWWHRLGGRGVKILVHPSCALDIQPPSSPPPGGVVFVSKVIERCISLKMVTMSGNWSTQCLEDSRLLIQSPSNTLSIWRRATGMSINILFL